MPACFAAIDIGSNSALLTIVGAGKDSLKILVDEAHITGLSKGVSTTQNISEERLKTSIAILERYRQLVDSHAVKELKVVGTEVFRKAQNGQAAKQRLEKSIGAPIEIISGDREAELSFWSVQKEFADKKALKLVFDIGGASTELCLGNDVGIQKRISLKFGSVLLSEKFGLGWARPKSREAVDEVTAVLKTVEWAQQMPPTLGIGVAGTTTTLAALDLQLVNYSREKVHGVTVTRQACEIWMEKLLERSPAERAKFPGLPLDRADVFAGGISIIYGLMKFFEWEKITCMDSGVRFGLLYEMLTV